MSYLSGLNSPKLEMDISAKVVLGSFAFLIFWMLASFDSVPFLPIGRTAGSLLGSVLMVVFQVTTPTQAYSSIDLSILGLLFGTMVIGIYLERAHAFKYLRKLLSWKSLGPKDLICRVCLVSAVTSAFFTNDTVCTILTEFVLQTAREQNLSPKPFLLALASSANIGSSATAIGNPQNLVIAFTSGISFWTFLLGVFPAAIVGVSVNSMLLLCMYWQQLSSQGDEEGYEDTVAEDDGNYDRFSPATVSHESAGLTEVVIFRQESGADDEESPDNVHPLVKWTDIIRTYSVYPVTTGMLIALFMGFNMAWTATTAALTLIVVDFRNAQQCLEKVSYSILIFFCGMFMTIEGFDETGIPNFLWELVEPYAKIDSATGIVALAVVITVLSSLVSNVSTVLLLGSRMAASASSISTDYVQKSWLILAWTSTVAGNLSLVGSAANMIVCEQAGRAPFPGYRLSFWSHLKFGVPSTIIVTAVGLAILA